MAGQVWSIQIVPGTKCASFVPDVYSPEPTSVLQAQLADLVSWNNQTDQQHWIWLTDETYSPQRPLTDAIPPFHSSQPGYVIQQTDVFPATTTPPPPPQTVYYYCSIHPDEHGTINVVA